MKLSKWLENWDMTSLRIKAGFLDMEWAPQEADRDAAWELYIELLTRIATQPLGTDGDEQVALDSVYSIFGITRDITKKYGRDCFEFTKIAVVMLNQKIRPFTAKWHKLSSQNSFRDPKICKQFREELCELQIVLAVFSNMLADMAEVEDLT